MIIVADLAPFEIGDNFDLKEEGTLSIDLVFKSPLTATINVLVYAEYDNVIEIDSNRNVIKDWMNTFQLAQVLTKDPFTKESFAGVYEISCLPSK